MIKAEEDDDWKHKMMIIKKMNQKVNGNQQGKKNYQWLKLTTVAWK